MRNKIWIGFLVAILCSGVVYAKPNSSKSSSSKSSSAKFSSPKSSTPKSSSSSKPKFSSPSSKKPESSGSSSKPKFSSPFSKKPESNGSSSSSPKPKFSSPFSKKPETADKPASKFSSPSTKSESTTKSGPSGKSKFSSPFSNPLSKKPAESKVGESQPKFSSPANEKVQPGPKPKFGSPNASQTTTSTSSGSNNQGFSSPKISDKARANKQAASRDKYLAQQKATAPPKSEYKSPTGKTVKIDTTSKHVESIRNKPSSYYTPQARQQRYETHVVHHHYSHPYSWYASQPSVYVGGGYSSVFWWMMMTEWSAERRAAWLYNNRDRIERDAYERGVQDAEVRRRIQDLEARNSPRNRDYIDPEFQDDPSAMYEQEAVEAMYNPVVAPATNSSSVPVKGIVWGLIILSFGILAIVFFFVRIGK